MSQGRRRKRRAFLNLFPYGCPCGFFTDPKKECQCAPHQVERYLAKISGPLLDRIDIHLEVPALPSRDLLSQAQTESSQDIKSRTSQARRRQQERFRHQNIFANAQMNQKLLRKYCTLTEAGRQLLKTAIEELGLSARAHDRLLKVARTVSDLAGSEQILPEHLAEAIQYRSLDRNGTR